MSPPPLLITNKSINKSNINSILQNIWKINHTEWFWNYFFENYTKNKVVSLHNLKFNAIKVLNYNFQNETKWFFNKTCKYMSTNFHLKVGSKLIDLKFDEKLDKWYKDLWEIWFVFNLEGYRSSFEDFLESNGWKRTANGLIGRNLTFFYR